jgi:hypothetical protein
LASIPVRSFDGSDEEAFREAWREQLVENFDDDDILRDPDIYD